MAHFPGNSLYAMTWDVINYCYVELGASIIVSIVVALIANTKPLKTKVF
jgi:hypothetical protein